ncbi:MAG: DHH family phosphoesterase [Candidatus Diapherotrites archaeon]|nr:DHH family phosphoesterase [Candidatus Micrarchaeota archaeon]MBU1939478.1 DHH family phosphoesterase [Candidatus Micrarchaeota archaeon]
MKGASFLSSLKNKKLLIVTHIGADVDAFGSAAAFYFAFAKACKKLTILVPEHMNLNAKSLARSMHVPYTHHAPALSEFDLIIVLDLNSGDMLGTFAPELKKFPGKVFLIDHHEKSGDKLSPKLVSFINEKAVSTSEIVHTLFRGAKVKITPEIARCLASGIITDSAGFLVADPNTFRIMAELLEKSECAYSDITALFNVKTDISEKIARLKSARRCRIFGSGDYLIVATDVGAFEASAATALVKLGADVAFAGDAENGKIRISARANNRFVNKEKFEFTAHVFRALEKEFPGNGGGHAAAAGFNGTGNEIWPVLKRCVALTHNFISDKKNKKNKDKSADPKEYS